LRIDCDRVRAITGSEFIEAKDTDGMTHTAVKGKIKNWFNSG
jgi:hypothetical protein